MSKVWSSYRDKISKVSKLNELVVYNNHYIQGFGLNHKVCNGVLVPREYNKLDRVKND